jgi:hypothetical protein
LLLFNLFLGQLVLGGQKFRGLEATLEQFAAIAEALER